MTEDELTALVIAECGRHGILVHHCKDSRYCEGTPGIPDLIIATEKGIIFAELKTRDGETSADQDLWHAVLYMATHGYPAVARETESRIVRYRLWRPEHWDSGAIQATLEQLATP